MKGEECRKLLFIERRKLMSNDNQGLIILGIIALFLAYLAWLKSQQTTVSLTQAEIEEAKRELRRRG
jgi:hypothetical protein